jgi:translation initiation factor IF-3
VIFNDSLEDTTISRKLAPPVKQQFDGPRMNDRIRISPIRVVDDEGNMLGEMDTDRARELAREAGLDLVEVSPEARPPVCRIMDYGKVQYEKHKKQKAGTKQHQTQLKQIRLRAKTGSHDIEVKIRKAREFLAKKDKVKINVLFRGRENAHHARRDHRVPAGCCIC